MILYTKEIQHTKTTDMCTVYKSKVSSGNGLLIIETKPKEKRKIIIIQCSIGSPISDTPR